MDRAFLRLILFGCCTITFTTGIGSKCPDDGRHDDLNITIDEYISLSNIGHPRSMRIQDNTGDIFIGGDDAVAAISNNFTEKTYFHYGKGSENHINFLMLDERNKLLVACGTADSGLCIRHSSENITSHIRIQGNDMVDHISSSNGTTAGTISYQPTGTGSKTSVVFHLARTLDSNFEYTKQQSVSSKIWNKDKTGFELFKNFSFNLTKEHMQSSMTVSKQYASTYKISYIFAFSDNGYSYFITKQKKTIDSAKYEIRIIRICESDASLENYIEMQIVCKSKQKKFTEPISAYFNEVSREFIVRKGLLSNKALFLLAYDSDKKSDYTVCVYDMVKVNQAFDAHMKNCLGGIANDNEAIRMGLNFYFNGTERYCKDLSSDAYSSDLCSRAKPFYIKRNLFGKNVLRENGKPLRFLSIPTTIAVTTDKETQEYTVIILGFQNGDIKLLYLEPEISDGISAVGVNLSPHNEIIHLQVHERSIYAVTKSTLHKIEINNFCRVLPNCYRCVTYKFLQCGFCDDNGCFAPQKCPCNICTNSSCSPMIYNVFPRTGPRQGGTKITICGQGLGHVIPGLLSTRKVLFGDLLGCSVTDEENFNNLTCLTQNLERQDSPTKFPMSVHIYSPSSPDQAWHDRFGINKTIDVGFFTYLEPAVFDFFPRKGPKRGGTTVTILGKNLHVGSSAKAVIGDKTCEAYFRNQTVLKCRISRFRQPALRMIRSADLNEETTTNSVQLHIDNARLEVPGSFDYKKDPNLTMPLAALRSIERYSTVQFFRQLSFSIEICCM